jgi:hypothetical protein
LSVPAVNYQYLFISVFGNPTLSRKPLSATNFLHKVCLLLLHICRKTLSLCVPDSVPYSCPRIGLLLFRFFFGQPCLSFALFSDLLPKSWVCSSCKRVNIIGGIESTKAMQYLHCIEIRLRLAAPTKDKLLREVRTPIIEIESICCKN